MDTNPNPLWMRSTALEGIRTFLERLSEPEVALLFGHLLALGWDRARSERVLKAAKWWL